MARATRAIRRPGPSGRAPPGASRLRVSAVRAVSEGAKQRPPNFQLPASNLQFPDSTLGVGSWRLEV